MVKGGVVDDKESIVHSGCVTDGQSWLLDIKGVDVLCGEWGVGLCEDDNVNA